MKVGVWRFSSDAKTHTKSRWFSLMYRVQPWREPFSSYLKVTIWTILSVSMLITSPLERSRSMVIRLSQDILSKNGITHSD
jgi:hypothetical protein